MDVFRLAVLGSVVFCATTVVGIALTATRPMSTSISRDPSRGAAIELPGVAPTRARPFESRSVPPPVPWQSELTERPNLAQIPPRARPELERVDPWTMEQQPLRARPDVGRLDRSNPWTGLPFER